MSEAKHTPGPFVLDSWGDYIYVVSEAGVRMAKIDDDDTGLMRAKAEQICAALNATHYFAAAIATGEPNP